MDRSCRLGALALRDTPVRSVSRGLARAGGPIVTQGLASPALGL